MPRIRVAIDDLQRLLWPGEHNRVVITDAKYEHDRSVVLTVKGERLPEGDFLKPVVSRWEETKFTPCRPIKQK